MAQPRRIALVVNNLNVGGLEKVVISLAKHLDRARFTPYLVCLNGPGTLFDSAGLGYEQSLVMEKRARRIGPISVDVESLIELRQFLSEKHIDLVHTHNAAPLIYAGLAARSLRPSRRPRVVYTEHNQIYSASPSGKKKFRAYVRLADHVVAVSHDLDRTLEREVRLKHPVEVIHNGIDGTRFSAVDGSRIREEIGATSEDFVVGTGVVLSKQKGIRYLIEAAAQVVTEEPRVRFAIAGDGPLRAELESLATAKKLGDRFLFLGYRGDMPEVISALDLYVLPSLHEGLPLCLCEALAMGKPVLCTRVGGSPEVVEDGQNGFVVPPADPGALATRILELARDPELIQRMQRDNRARFEQKFSEHAMVGAHERMYERVLA